MVDTIAEVIHRQTAAMAHLQSYNLLQNFSKIEETTEPIKSEVFPDDIVNSWPLMGSIWPIAGILSAYLLFVLKIGPKIMEDKKPLEIRKVMLVYNLFQVFQNGRIIWLYFVPPGVITYTITHICAPMGMTINNPFVLPLCIGSWWFLVSKMTDLIDTVFFVLRKKQSHVTFLHVYHHTNMVFSVWLYLKYMKDEHFVLVGILNSFLHVFMYSYYFLAALGPAAQKYLWWKKYITRLQIVQFLMAIAFLSALLVFDCGLNFTHLLWLGANVACFLSLFLRFYSKTYTQKEDAVAEFKLLNEEDSLMTV